MAQHRKAPKEVHITVSSATILKIVGIVAGAALLYFLRDIVALVLIALLIAVSVDPIVDALVRKKIPRGLAAALTFVGFIIVVVGILLLVIPSVLSQASDLLTSYSWLVEDLTGGAIPLQSWISGDLTHDAGDIVETIRQAGVAEALPSIIEFASAMFGGMLTVILVLALSFYMVIEERVLRIGVLGFLPEKQKKTFEHMLPVVRERIGSWLRGQLLLMFIMFVVSYSILRLLDIPFALVLAMMAGLLDIIPFIGAIVAFFPIVLVALSSSLLQAILVGFALIVNQQIHGDIFTPKIMQKAAGMNPVVTIVALLIGFELAGVLGAILAIPVTMLIGVFAQEWQAHKK